MAKRKAKRRARKRDPLAGLPPHVADLYRAVQNYVTKLGGNIVVIGGVEVLELPGDPAHKYRLAVPFLGTKPQFREDSDAKP